MKSKFTDKDGNIVMVVDSGSSLIIPVGFAAEDATPMADDEWDNYHAKQASDNAKVAASPSNRDLQKQIDKLQSRLDDLANTKSQKPA